MKKPTIAVLGSHSALDVCRGAKDEGFETLVVAEKGREQTYSTYYASKGSIGCVDACLVLPKFSDILSDDVQRQLEKRQVIFVPNRSFEAYCHFDYKAIEKKFVVPMFGNKYLLKIEERGARPNQYDLLKKAAIRYPKHFSNAKDIDRLCLVKMSEKTRVFERAFFLAKDYADFRKKSGAMIASGKITQKALDEAVIEEFVLGAQVNFNFFYSPLEGRLELLGTDTRRQTNLEGILRTPAPYQEALLKEVGVSYEEAGHIAVTVLESLLEPAFEMGESFVAAARELYAPGIIGPFALQAIITPGPPKKDIVVVDVSPRMPGSPGIAASPYSGYLFGSSISVGRRVAQEIKEAIRMKQLKKVVT